MPRLILASASPARARLLSSAGLTFDVVVSGVDEDESLGVEALARAKAQAVAASLSEGLVLGCDSMFLFEGVMFGKPASVDEAVARWRRMRGRSGVLHTGHCLVDAASGAMAEEADRTIVRFAEVSDDDIAAYVGTGEPLRVAGGFTLDDVGAPFVESVVGNPGTVIGVSLAVVRRLLAALGVSITELWR